MAKDWVRVYETGNVNELAVENRGEEAVFIQAGDIVKGGKQDRSLTVSLILPPHSKRTPIASFCVEPGRWAQRGREDVKQFSSAAAAMPSREAKLAMKAPAPAQDETQRSLASDPSHRPAAETQERQRRVWDYVASINRELSNNLGTAGHAVPPPNSLQTALEDDKLKAAQQAYIDQLRPAGEKEARHHRLRLCRERQDQQRRCLLLERAVPKDVAEAVGGQRHRGDRQSRCGSRRCPVNRRRQGVRQRQPRGGRRRSPSLPSRRAWKRAKPTRRSILRPPGPTAAGCIAIISRSSGVAEQSAARHTVASRTSAPESKAKPTSGRLSHGPRASGSRSPIGRAPGRGAEGPVLRPVPSWAGADRHSVRPCRPELTNGTFLRHKRTE